MKNHINRDQMMTTAQFLEKVENFLRDNRVTATAFGRKAMNNPNFVFSLRDGRSPTLQTAERVLSFMDKYPTSSANSEASN